MSQINRSPSHPQIDVDFTIDKKGVTDLLMINREIHENTRGNDNWILTNH